MLLQAQLPIRVRNKKFFFGFSFPFFFFSFDLIGPFSSLAYGTVFSGVPFWEERSSLVWLNVVRQTPSQFKAFLPPVQSSVSSFLLQAPVRPLLFQYDLTRAARAHSRELTETCPGTSTPHNSCDGTDAFTRIKSFYTPGSSATMAENVNQPDASSNQYFHVPKHNLRAFVCDGMYGMSGTGNQAWPLQTCPSDGPSAGHRAAIMNPVFRYVGIGVWGRGGNLINAAPQVHTQDFASEFVSAPHYPSQRIYSASHIFIGSGAGENMDTMQFFVNYYFSSPPTSARVWLEGTWIDVTCKPGWGTNASNCVYTSNVMPTPAACLLYFVQFVDSAGTSRYPAEGAFYTYGSGTCRRDWISATEANPIIAGLTTGPQTTGGSQITFPQTTQSSGAVMTTTPRPVTQSFPTAPPGGGPGTGPGTSSPLVVGARGARLRIRYFANFVDYVSNGAFTQQMVLLRNSTAQLLGISPSMLGAEAARVSEELLSFDFK